MNPLPTFTPPSPGAWQLEQAHVTRPLSVFMAEILPPNLIRGFSDATRAYGMLLDHFDAAVVNRFFYLAPRPVGAPKGAKGAPPKALFWLLQRVHAEMRWRIRRADEVFRTRHWREELRWWDTEVKPAIAAKARALLQEDLDGCSPAALVSHVRRAAAFSAETVYWHHRFNAAVMVPLGDFLVHAMQWTGLPPEEILQVMRGLSPASAGATGELEALRAAIRGDDDAQALLGSSREPGELLKELERRPTGVAATLRAYLDVVGLRVIGGYDVADDHAREHPELLVKIIRASVAGVDEARGRAAAERAVHAVRERVPEAHRAAFDDLLREAQLTYRLRDERIFHGDGLGMGVARRALLAAGRRLAAQGLVRDPAHLVDASLEEIVALLEGRRGPSAEEIEARFTWRIVTPLSAAPAELGLPPSQPPPADWLPAGAARLARITDTVVRLLFDPRPKGGRGTATLKGFGVSPGVYEGPARVIRTVADLPQIQSGEVLVATSTGPSFNVVLPLIGAIVTERGGALSHPAIVAREYGLPGVVGCPDATTTIVTGMRVRVDGGTGEVWPIG